MENLLPNSRRPDVSFHQSGRIDITAHVAKLLHLQQGDVIGVMLSGGEYMLYVRLRDNERVGRHEGQVFPTNRGKRHTNNFRAYSRRMCQAMIHAAGVSGTARLPVGTPLSINDTTAIPIIYKYNLQ